MLESTIIVRQAPSATAPYMPSRLPTYALLCLAGSMAAQECAAIGFGRPQSAAVLGQVLEFAVPVRLEADETLLPECISVDVGVGDARLPRSSVGVSLDTSGATPTIRVRTLERIDEPVVTVTVSAGCGARVARQFTLFPDPPGAFPSAPVVADAAAVAAGAAATVSSQAPVAQPAAGASVDAPAGAARPYSGAAAQAGGTAISAPIVPSRRPARAALEPATAASKPRAAAVPRAATARPQPAEAQAVPPKPRLKLDAPAMSAAAAAAAASAAQREITLKAAEAAASTARGAAAEAALRVAELEKGIAALRLESQANREAMERLNRALAESQDRASWTPLLSAAALLLGAVAGFLGWRLWRRREEGDDWWSLQQGAGRSRLADEPSDKGGVDDSIYPITVEPDELSTDRSQPALASTPGSVVAAPSEPSRQPPKYSVADHGEGREDWASITQVLPPGVGPSGSAGRELSIEELLDLEQQAEFFAVLGQDDAAIDLLLEHLRNTGGTVPLPYLKLMEIYRRQGDREAYERTRERFNLRFNALAPEWEADQAAGRTLENYPDVIARLQGDWPRPVDAMTTLENLLFRADGGEVFDLPAYRDVLFLYAMAHDLIKAQPGAGSSRIDVMLPLADQSARSLSSPVLGAPVSTLDISFDDQQTVPLDLPASVEEPHPAGKRPGPIRRG